MSIFSQTQIYNISTLILYHPISKNPNNQIYIFTQMSSLNLPLPLLLLVFPLLVSTIFLGCASRLPIPIKLDSKADYSPSFKLTFQVSLSPGQTFTSNLTTTMTAEQQCNPNTYSISYKFKADECSSGPGLITCQRDFYLNCTKKYSESNKNMTFTVSGRTVYQDRDIQCQNKKIVEWAKGDSDDDNTILIVGISVGAAVVVLAAGAVIWWRRTRKNARQPLAEETILTQ